ncbi:MAG: hypothetical protein KGL99_16060 [Burkholderiales bacterium]|nr:hypothetical protein [Burkholderiales bacterium]
MPKLHPPLRTLGSVLLWQALLQASLQPLAASAAPVRLDAATLRPPGRPGDLGQAAAPAPMPALVDPPSLPELSESPELLDLLGPAGARARSASRVAAPRPGLSASRPADKAQGDATGAARTPASAAVSQSAEIDAASRSPAGDEIDPDLKDAAKAAHQWVMESMPWARQLNFGDVPYQLANEGAEALSRVLPRTWLTTGPEGPNVGDTRESRSSVGMDQAHRFNLVGEALKFAREVLEHPMTWLVIALMVLGKLAVWMAGRHTRGRPARQTPPR